MPNDLPTSLTQEPLPLIGLADDGSSAPALTRGLTLAMAIAAGIAVANIYYNQPMLAIMERDMPGRLMPYIPTVTQLGYAAGLFLIVPLGDIFERRRLIIVQFFVLAVALIGAAVAQSALMILIASLTVGVSATVAQQIVPFAAQLSPPDRRGATVGTVIAGVLCGILLSRTIAGFVATELGWREMFWISVPMAIVAGLWMAIKLPSSPVTRTVPYWELERSLFSLWREFAELRLAASTQALLFASFTAFWTILAFRLQEPRFALGADVAGLFGIVGAVGILAAPLAGRMADKKGPRPVIILGAVLTLAAWAVFGLWLSIAGLVVGVILLDFAVQSALVSNQHLVFSLRPEARSRINTVFMGTMFLGGSAGSAAATFAWNMGGWTAVAALGGALGIGGCVLQVVGLRTRR